MSELERTLYRSPIGALEIAVSAAGLAQINFLDDAPPKGAPEPTDPVLLAAVKQLDEYFDNRRTVFDLPLDLAGTPFQQSVWRAVLAIPFGETISYLDLALRLGDRRALRAVGAANGKNPVPIVVPCHRVIGADGDLTGYGGGLWRKEWLLAHEGRPTQQRLFP